MDEKKKAFEHVFKVFLRLALLWLKLFLVVFVIAYFGIIFIRWLV